MNNRIFTLIGPHNSGKTTIVHKLMDLGITYIPLYTTRAPKPWDSGKKTLTFLSSSAFLQKDWIVKVTYKGDYYGILKTDMLNALKNHKISVCIMDINGVKQISKLLTNKLETVFLMVDYVTLVDRMLRNGHTNVDMKYHLEYAETNGEFENWKTCNHVIKNIGSVDNAYNQLLAIMGISVPASRDFISKL